MGSTGQMTGKISRLVRPKGFGFIEREGGPDMFFHRSAVRDERGYELLMEGQTVVFEEERSERGPRATNVRVCG